MRLLDLIIRGKKYVSLKRTISEKSHTIEIVRELADFLFLENYVKRLLTKRNNTIKQYAESDLWKEVLKEI